MYTPEEKFEKSKDKLLGTFCDTTFDPVIEYTSKFLLDKSSENEIVLRF